MAPGVSPWQRVGEPLGTPRRGAAVTGGVYSQLLPLGARQPGSLNRSEAVRAPWLDRSRRAPSCYQRRADEPSAAVITTAPSCPSPTTCTGTGSTRRPALQQLTPVGQLKKKKKKHTSFISLARTKFGAGCLCREQPLCAGIGSFGLSQSLRSQQLRGNQGLNATPNTDTFVVPRTHPFSLSS